MNAAGLGAWTKAVTYMAAVTPYRLYAAQLATFSLAALGDRKGQPLNFTDLRDAMDGAPGGSVHTTYSIFLEQHKGRRQLGWLRQEPDVEDGGVKWLRLTKEGERVIDTLLRAMEA